jgi:hypothetical protein
VTLYDLKQLGRTGDDPRILFSWYSGDPDPALAELPREVSLNAEYRSAILIPVAWTRR